MSGTIDLKELEDVGYLQEANRQYFNLLGLDLRIESLGNNKFELVVVDRREDPLGFVHPDKYDKKKGERIYDEFAKRSLPRRTLFGGNPKQPIDRLIPPGQIKKMRKQIEDSGGYAGRLKPQ